jgi:hypothetical protein
MNGARPKGRSMPEAEGRRSRRVAALLISSFWLLSGCVAAPAGAVNPASSGADDRAAVETGAPGDCFDLAVEKGYGAPTTINDLRSLAAEAFVGAFTSFGEAQWNTPGGQRPSQDEFQTTPARIYRPIAFDITEVILGKNDPSTFSLRGGTSGCDSITYDDGIVLDKGATYVGVLAPIDDSQGQPSGRLNLLAAWPVDADGTVHTTADGDLPLKQVEGGLLNGLEPSPPPSPGEVEPSGP